MTDHIDSSSHSSGAGAAGALERIRLSFLEATRFTPADGQRMLRSLSLVAGALTLLALGDLAVRSALRLNSRWDAFAYHLPFAAIRGGLSIPYEMNEQMVQPFQGYPPLPHFIQGVLWRVTGSMNATGVVNYLAFAGFLAYAHRVLRAPIWIVGLISLTAPMIIIHSSVSYVDLFGNSFLAAGACSCLYIFLFPEAARRSVYLGGMASLALAAWTKYLLVPVAAVVFCVFAVLALRPASSAGISRRKMAWLLAATALIALAPYIKNVIAYGNPFWPFGLPVVGQHVPHTNDAIHVGPVEQPVELAQSSRLELFFTSLFEIGQPTRYPFRLRWTIDQGLTDVAFRMGGFWGIAACFYGVALSALLVLCHRRRGAVAVAGAWALLLFIANLPQSHQLRYYLFIPLSGAATLGMLFSRFEQLAPRTAPVFLAVVMGLFSHMVFENREHYRVERIDYQAAAREWGAADWWPKLERGKTYCAVDLVPLGMMLTGPTMKEFKIVDRTTADLCPPGSIHLTKPASL